MRAKVMVLVLSRSDGFKRYIRGVVGKEHEIRLINSVPDSHSEQGDQSSVFLLHASSFRKEFTPTIEHFRSAQPHAIIAVASDIPELGEMLSLSRYRINAYFNSYMADIHYRQMLRLLATGQTWFIPELLARALELAGRVSARALSADEISQLTPREIDIARAIATGLSNQEIASSMDISERTVKTHLTHIYGKLGIRDRTTLAIRLNATAELAPQRSAGYTG